MVSEREKQWVIVMLLLVGAVLAAPVLLGGSAEAEKAVLVVPSRGLDEFPSQMALVKGYYQEQGFALQKLQMNSVVGVKALVAGEVDFILAWGSTLRAAVTGVPVKVVMGLAVRPLQTLISRPEIRSPADLKGKTIGMSSFGSTVDYLARFAVKHYGLDPERDVKVVQVGESALRLAALKAGFIDATPIDVAFAVKAEDEGFRRLVYLGDIINLPLSGIGVTLKKLQGHPDQIRRAIRATLKGLRAMRENRADAVAQLSKYLGLTPSQAARSYEISINSFSTDGRVSDEGVKLDIQLVRERLKMTKEVPISQVADWSLLTEVLAEGR